MNLISQISKYLFLILILLYTLQAYSYFRKKSHKKRESLLKRQRTIISVFVLLGYLIIYIHTLELLAAVLGVAIVIYIPIVASVFRRAYPNSSMLLIHDMLMLLGVGFVVIGRLNLDQAAKQFVIAGVATLVMFLVPVLIRKLPVLSRIPWVYAVLGLLGLMAVLALAVTSGGAKLSISVAGITVQFSEPVKITLVFFIAAMYAKSTAFKNVVVTTVIAALHVIILVLSTDLGTALVFFVAYLLMTYVATERPLYTFAGALCGAGAAVLAYFLFNHVRQRIAAWKDPFAVYDGPGYQIAQGLFAIGSGGLFGAGFFAGTPQSIPVASKDYVFAALSEEFGAIFGIAVILICMNLFLLIVNISLRVHKPFYKLVALGLGIEYGFQIFLTIGGVIKFIPLTGITLPLISYGGSSLFTTIFMLAVVQGIYIIHGEEVPVHVGNETV